MTTWVVRCGTGRLKNHRKIRGRASSTCQEVASYAPTFQQLICFDHELARKLAQIGSYGQGSTLANVQLGQAIKRRARILFSFLLSFKSATHLLLISKINLCVGVFSYARLLMLYLSKKQYAIYRNVSLSTINRLIKIGLPVIRVLRRVTINTNIADNWLDNYNSTLKPNLSLLIPRGKRSRSK